MALLKPSTWEIILEGSPDVTLLNTTSLMEREPTWSASYNNQKAPRFRASDVAQFNRGHTSRRLSFNRVATFATVNATRNAMITAELAVAAWVESASKTVTINVYTEAVALDETYTLFEAKVVDYNARIHGALRLSADYTIEFGDVTVL